MVLKTSEHSTQIKGVKKKLLVPLCLGAACLMIAIALMATDPVIIITQFRSRVRDGSPMFDFLKAPIESIHLKAYLFNVTNSERFLSGEDHNLKVKEVGPFTYREVRHQENLELDLEANLIKYEPRSEITFVPEESVGDPELMNVTMPNLPMLGITSRVSSYPYWTKLGFNLLASQLKSKPIVTVSASTYLWGYKEPLVSLAHTVLPGFINFNKIGIMDRFYDTKIKNKLELGSQPHDKFMIKTRNGYTKLPMGEDNNPENCEICEDFTNSYEGISYPIAITKDTPIKIFRNGLCRLLPMVYHDEIVTEEGVHGLVFNLSDSFYSLDPNVTENRILDLTKCFYGLPVGLTKVHFLGMDKKIYERIEGIKPDPTKECFVIIEPEIALQLETYFPVQINLVLSDMNFNKEAKLFSNLVLPIGYVEIIQPPLPDDTIYSLKLLYTIGPQVVLGLKILFWICAVIFITYSLILYLGLNTTRHVISFPMKISNNKVLIVQEPLMTAKPNEITYD